MRKLLRNNRRAQKIFRVERHYSQRGLERQKDIWWPPEQSQNRASENWTKLKFNTEWVGIQIGLAAIYSEQVES